MMKPNKRLGQNFLINEKISDQIVEAAGLTREDTVLEIGPGTGILTVRLAKLVGQLLAVEKDYDLAYKLQSQYKGAKNTKIIHQDALWFDLFSLTKYKVVANIPYNITSPLIRRFLENEPRPELLVLMVQKEVAERICAKPGDRDRGLLTLIIEYYAEAEILFQVGRKEFFPSPEVDSAVIKITPKISFDSTQDRPIDSAQGRQIEPALFFKVVKAGFSSKRQQIHNSLAGTLRLTKPQTEELLKISSINSMLRAEDLTLDDWIHLALNYKKTVLDI